MKRKSKIAIGIAVVAVVLVFFRIYYVNEIAYKDPILIQMNMGQTINFGSMSVVVQSMDFYSKEQLESNYDIGDGEAEDSHIVVACVLSNHGDEEQLFNLSKVTIEIGKENGGCINPYLFQPLNPECGSDLVLSPGESRIIYMPYPMEKKEMEEKLYAVFSLYPQKIQVSLN